MPFIDYDRAPFFLNRFADIMKSRSIKKDNNLKSELRLPKVMSTMSMMAAEGF